MQQLDLNKTIIRSLPLPDRGHVDYRDTSAQYLRLRVGRTVKSWYYVRKVNGRVNWIKLGVFPDMPPKMARDRHDVVSGQLALGQDPDARPRRRGGKLTFGMLYEQYMDEHMRPKRKPSSVADDESRWRLYLEAWAGVRAGQVTQDMVAALHVEIGAKYAFQANRVICQVSRIYSYGARRHPQLEGYNPAKGITRFKELRRKRFLRGNELRALFVAIAEERGAWEKAQEVVDVDDLVSPRREPIRPDLLDFFEVLLWTGQRRKMVQSLRWDALDLEDGVWRIPPGPAKNSEEQMVVLGPAVAVLLRRSQSLKRHGTWVFPARRRWDGRPLGHIADPKKAWKRLLEQAGLQDVRMHDLRRTLGSWLAGSSANIREVMEILGHESLAAAQVYTELDLDPLRAAHKRATDAMRLAIGADQERKSSEWGGFESDEVGYGTGDA